MGHVTTFLPGKGGIGSFELREEHSLGKAFYSSEDGKVLGDWRRFRLQEELGKTKKNFWMARYDDRNRGFRVEFIFADGKGRGSQEDGLRGLAGKGNMEDPEPVEYYGSGEESSIP